MMTTAARTTALIIAMLFLPAPCLAQVPVTDAKREKSETETAACMERARTFKQNSVTPTKNIHGSITGQGDTGGIRTVSGQSISGSPFTGTWIGGVDFALLLGIAGTIKAIKTKNVGQTMASLAAVAAVIAANSQTLSTQSTLIGTSTTAKGAFEQNTTIRLSNAQVWNQAIEAVTTTNQLRTQRLLDLSAAASAATKAMTYDPQKVTLTAPQQKEETP